MQVVAKSDKKTQATESLDTVWCISFSDLKTIKKRSAAHPCSNSSNSGDAANISTPIPSTSTASPVPSPTRAAQRHELHILKI